jgi:hypothetical protein
LSAERSRLAGLVADWLIRHGVDDVADVNELLDLISHVYTENMAIMLESLAKMLRDRLKNKVGD